MQIATGILNIVFSVVLGSYWGLFGILAATVLARACTSLWYDPCAVYIHGFGRSPLEYLKKYLRYLVLLLIAAALCYFAFLLVGGNLLVKTLIKIILCSLIVNGVFLLAFCRTDEFKLLHSFVRRIGLKFLRH